MDISKAVPVVRPKRSKLAREERWVFALFVSPWFIGFLVFQVFVFAYGIYISFTNFSGLGPYRFVGLRNYIRAFTTYWTDTGYSLGLTLKYAVCSVTIGLVLSLALALLLNQKIKTIGLFRTVYYLPAVVPTVASTLVWSYMFDPTFGYINRFLQLIHLHPVKWIPGPPEFWALIIMGTWGAGAGTVLYLAALQGVPEHLLESAQIDGANAFQRFFRITLPMISPVILYTTITGIIGAMQLYTQAVLFGGGNPTTPKGADRSVYFFMVYITNKAFSDRQLGMGAALSWILFFIILLLTALLFYVMKPYVYYEVEQTGKEQ
ncbi:MAG: sugar ABC transporter permease [Firmicutes bacterium]|nr:sugar ABC transporter permease [Bacillota bacterium]